MLPFTHTHTHTHTWRIPLQTCQMALLLLSILFIYLFIYLLIYYFLHILLQVENKIDELDEQTCCAEAHPQTEVCTTNERLVSHTDIRTHTLLALETLCFLVLNNTLTNINVWCYYCYLRLLLLLTTTTTTTIDIISQKQLQVEGEIGDESDEQTGEHPQAELYYGWLF